MRFKSIIPVVLLGIPIVGFENPLLAAPIGYAIIDLDFRECRRPSLALEGVEGLGGMLEDFWSKLVEKLGLDICSNLRLAGVEGVNRAPLGGLYASLTSALLRSLHELHGGKFQTLDVIEISSSMDLVDVDRSWRAVVEALRYTATTGKPIAYRNPLEVYELGGEVSVKVEVEEYISNVKSRVSIESIGPTVYEILAHLISETVLEASIRVRDGAKLVDVIKLFKPIHEGVALAVYNIESRRGECLWSPGIPQFFERICLVG